jgi:chorismate-pyruvate lyase
LSEHYQRLRLPVPELEPVEPSEIPEPYRSLLVHDRDLTPTLEAAYGGPVHIRVLTYVVVDNVVSRLVVLVPDGSDAPASMGAIHIHLDRLPPRARRLVAKRRDAFGTILRKTRVPHYSHPLVYFEVMPDSMIADALRIGTNRVLYGRRNTIWDGAGEPLAEVVEILPPNHPPFSLEK